jgi:dolichol-phosphate mannosyltransferase
MNTALVIVPTYNERHNLPGLVERILRHARFDVLVVDDNSPDGTGALADELARQHPEVHVLHRQHKLGLGPAYVAGFRWALERPYEHVFEMDADHSHRPEQLPEFLAAAEHHDLVLGSRYLRGIRVLDWDLQRLLISAFGNWYARRVTGLPYTDLTGGYKCYRRCVLESIDLDRVQTRGYAFQIEMTWWASRRGFRIGEIPIVFYGRFEGETKFSRAIVWEAVWAVWKLRLGLMRNAPPPGVPPVGAPRFPERGGAGR